VQAPNVKTMRGKRDRAIISMLVGCGLRRSEVAELNVEDVQQRDERWVILDLFVWLTALNLQAIFDSITRRATNGSPD
jgi:integrase